MKFGLNFLFGNKSQQRLTNQRRGHDPESVDVMISRFISITSCLSDVLFAFLMFRTFGKFVDGFRKFGEDKKIPLSRNMTRFFGDANVYLNDYEMEILKSSVVDPCDMTKNFTHIGGLKDAKTMLHNCAEDMIDDDLPHDIYKIISGVLLYGPPGCGKSVLVKALCKEYGFPMIRVSPSTILRKYVGESQQHLKAAFTLAMKMQPCIMFFDEVDSIFRMRADDDIMVERELKTEAMQLWDDLVDQNARVLVVGATNRPQDLDPAIQRRFEISTMIGLPDKESRVQIFQALLQDIQIEKNFDYHKCAVLTDGYAASDIAAVCKKALSTILHERRERHVFGRMLKRILKSNSNAKSNDSSTSESTKQELRPVTTKDIVETINIVKPTIWKTNRKSSSQTIPTDYASVGSIMDDIQSLLNDITEEFKQTGVSLNPEQLKEKIMTLAKSNGFDSNQLITQTIKNLLSNNSGILDFLGLKDLGLKDLLFDSKESEKTSSDTQSNLSSTSKSNDNWEWWGKNLDDNENDEDENDDSEDMNDHQNHLNDDDYDPFIDDDVNELDNEENCDDDNDNKN